ncbi:hypothetical protein [Candidatus Cyrtobacter comes]|nr:hypothetical protein [Candidatus Cyrtobacter comes]
MQIDLYVVKSNIFESYHLKHRRAIDDDLLSWYKSALQKAKDISFRRNIAKIIFKKLALQVQDDIQLAKKEELLSFILEYIKLQLNFCKDLSNQGSKADLLSIMKDIPTEYILIYEKFIDLRDWL